MIGCLLEYARFVLTSFKWFVYGDKSSDATIGVFRNSIAAPGVIGASSILDSRLLIDLSLRKLHESSYRNAY